MKSLIKKSIKKYSKFFRKLSRHIPVEDLVQIFIERKESIIASYSSLELEFLKQFINIDKDKYKSQLGQDLFIDILNNQAEGGYFIEIGVGDGTNLSNSIFLEQKRNWRGLLCEPNKAYHQDIIQSRKSELVDKAVYNQSNLELPFLSVVDGGEFSTLEIHNYDKRKRANSISYNVSTINFTDLCKEFDVPNVINYVSIDTEGSELEILKSINLETFDIKAFTIEHNYDESKINSYKDILLPHNYKMVNLSLSQWDAWFIKNTK